MIELMILLTFVRISYLYGYRMGVKSTQFIFPQGTDEASKY